MISRLCLSVLLVTVLVGCHSTTSRKPSEAQPASALIPPAPTNTPAIADLEVATAEPLSTPAGFTEPRRFPGEPEPGATAMQRPAPEPASEPPATVGPVEPDGADNAGAGEPSLAAVVWDPGKPWVDLGAWSIEAGCCQPRIVTRPRAAVYECLGRDVSLEVHPGVKRARLNELTVHLGMEPRLEAGRLLIHGLDLEKTIVPLLRSPAPAMWHRRSVVIDPGHGGSQPGSRAITGNQLEKDLTLDWGLRLANLLVDRGWQVFLTRTNDIDMALAERIDYAEASGATLSISLHFNSAFPNAKVEGLETYCTTPAGLPSTVTRDYADETTRAFPNNSHDAANLRLAAAVHRGLIRSSGAADRGIRRARFMDVLRWQNRPAILVEGGYLSNPAESQRICDPGYRQRLAEAIAAALE